MTGIIFDLDGTLLDTLDDLTNSVNYTMRYFGCHERSRDEVRHFVGNGAYELIRRSLDSTVDPKSALTVYQQYYQEHCREMTAPYHGIPEVLSQLSQNCPLAIVSNKPDGAVKSLCSVFFPGIQAFGQKDSCPKKPSPDMLFYAMNKIGVDQCIYVGDSEVDVQTADNANVPCVSVLWGFRDQSELISAGAKLFCDDPKELPEVIRIVSEGESHGK